MGTPIPRLNQSKLAQNWLSMQPNSIDFCDGSGWGFGEVNEDNKLHGRGIEMWNGDIRIGYWQNGDLSTGHYIYIRSNGDFLVGDMYYEDGNIGWRGTTFRTNGTEEAYEY